MIILLSPDKKWRINDRKTWCFFPHLNCICDYKTDGCRKKRVRKEKRHISLISSVSRSV